MHFICNIFCRDIVVFEQKETETIYISFLNDIGWNYFRYIYFCAEGIGRQRLNNFLGETF